MSGFDPLRAYVSCIHIQGTRRTGDSAPFRFLSKENRAAEVAANAKHDNAAIRAAAAASPHADEETLFRLANDTEIPVREWVARNPAAPYRVLFYLSRDAEASVRGFVAWNRNTPEDLIKFLAEDEDATVRRLARIVLDNTEEL